MNVQERRKKSVGKDRKDLWGKNAGENNKEKEQTYIPNNSTDSRDCMRTGQVKQVNGAEGVEQQ